MSALSNKVAIVTGSATGLGAAVALQLADKGCNVVINYTKSETEAKETLAACEAKGVEAILAQGDVGEDADCRRIVQAAVDKWGRVDVLVNNAGGTKFANHAELDELNAEDFLWIYKVNVVGAYQMIRACAQHMKEAGKGSVVNISSIAGVTGIGSSVAYAATKGALNTMTLSLARALAPAIRVNAVCPGFIGTRWFKDEMSAEQYAKMEAGVAASVPLHVASGPDDIADSAVFFLTDASRHVTGETLMVDAGMHLGYAPMVAR